MSISIDKQPRDFHGSPAVWTMYAIFAPVAAIALYIPIWIYFSFNTAFIVFCVSLLVICPLAVLMLKVTARRDEKAYERYYKAAAFIDHLDQEVFWPHRYVGSIKPEKLTPKAAARYHTIKKAMTALGGIDQHHFDAEAFAQWEPKYLGFLHLVNPRLRADADLNELWKYPDTLRQEILSIEDSYIPDAITRISAYRAFITALRCAIEPIRHSSMNEAITTHRKTIADDINAFARSANPQLQTLRLTEPPVSTPPQELYPFYQQQLNAYFYGEWKELKGSRLDLRYTITDLSPDVEVYDRAMEQATHHKAVFQAVKANPADWYNQFRLLYEPLKLAYEQYLETSGLFQLGTTADTTQPNPNTVAPYVLTLEPSHRTRHMYVIGKTGSGKTTFLRNLIAQDLRNRTQGVVVISPENKIFEDLLALLPSERANDLIYFDPTDTTPPVIGFNPFAIEAGDDLNQKAQETYTIFERALGELGVKMTTLLQNAAYALIQRTGSKLTDLDKLLYPADNSLRHAITRDPRIDERTRRFWDAYDSSTYYKSAYEPVVNRLDPFFRPPHATILSTASFSWHDALNTRPSIIFCNLSRLKGMEAQIMGQLIMAQIQQTIFRRDPLPESTYIDYSLYIDEFQTYAQTSEQSFIETLNKARKYHVAMTLAHQVTSDIPPKLLSSIVGNVGTVVALQLSAEDAPFFTKDLQLKDGDGHARPDMLQNLPVGMAIARTPAHNEGIVIRIPAQPPQRPTSAEPLTPQELKQRSKTKYGTVITQEPAIMPPQTTWSASEPTPERSPQLLSAQPAAAIVLDETEDITVKPARKRGRPRKIETPTNARITTRSIRKPASGNGTGDDDAPVHDA